MKSLAERPARNAGLRAVTVLALTAALAGTVAAAPAGARRAPAATGGAHGGPPPAQAEQRRLQRAVERTLRDAGYVSVSVELRQGRRTWYAQAGEAELGTGRPVPRHTSFRAASVTKTFVATVLLQLAAEGRVSLDDTVDHWLPGLVSGNGNDGRRITLRNLLQHTSGLHNYRYAEDVGNTAADFERTRFDHVGPEQLIAGALRHQPDFPPADPADEEPDWHYSNSGYVLAGMIIERATGRSWSQEVRDRIVRPLRLTDTYDPGDDASLRAPHAHSYYRFPGSTGWTDTTVLNISRADAAGALVSSARDLDTFFTALLGGRLLPAAQLAEMRRTVSLPEEYDQIAPGLRYGLGLMRQPLSCGGFRWGHTGDSDGGTIRTGLTSDGRRSVVVSASGGSEDEAETLRAERAVQRLVDQALCGPGPS
ncbi:serine hydrolase domain-containing protein [Streptomyces palmae]|uniref:Class A beta-lactamase-related serine hydrolase n=1 Tax=Streptomyces palmae TaxID=1701085 RepID=A0A4Z0HA50_9ACTN|nr:serine hydrolase domain-containing protein [Streptomyces palmae]TGB14950.1 class A beta-lactamase-related serine hydrolase [Streptomyces palmae]